MTAAERLWTALKRLSDAAPVDLAGLIDDVSAAVDDARLAERRAIVAWLRRRPTQRLRAYEVEAAAERLRVADEIERGEYEAAS